MMNRKASVARWVALAIVPLSLMAVLAQKGRQRRAEAATFALFRLGIRDGMGGDMNALIADGADVNARSDRGSTNLHLAASLNRTEKIEALLNNGADINARDSAGITALMYAVEGSQDGYAPTIEAHTVRLLLEKGADLNIVDNSGHTALSRALLLKGKPREGFGYELKNSNQLEDIIRLLKAAGAKE